LQPIHELDVADVQAHVLHRVEGVLVDLLTFSGLTVATMTP